MRDATEWPNDEQHEFHEAPFVSSAPIVGSTLAFGSCGATTCMESEAPDGA